MLPKSLIQLLEKHRDKIEGTIEDETDTGDGYWVYLRPGWCTDDIGLHTIHEDIITKTQCGRLNFEYSCFVFWERGS